ncbi:MAG TPA: patatin-like phospholipase family protein [Methylomirabilota bacterium]|jgi:predicted acylesterase/phospholipase RssA
MSRLPPRHAILVLVAAGVLAQGCAVTTHFAYGNHPLETPERRVPQASFEIQRRPTKQQGDVLVLLALSGGGSRAAYFAARTMLALEQVPGPQDTPRNVLKEVDLISSVSGGSLTAAYYASTFDPGHPPPPKGRRIWDERTLRDLMSHNYIRRWVGNWFWPLNVLKFWFTAFDRTDIMAQTFADNLFDNTRNGTDLRFRDLNPARPNLILNATIGSRSYAEDDASRAKVFGTVFTFTQEDFATKLNSEIGRYELANGVMASATFPAVFNFMTLRDFHNPARCPDGLDQCYIHVFDGGNADNLGLLSIKRALLSNHAALVRERTRIVVIFVDAFRRSLGAEAGRADPRLPLSYVVDTNFLDATDSLLEGNRQRLLEDFFARTIAGHQKVEQCRRDNLPDHACVASPAWQGPSRTRLEALLKEKMFFFHITFDAVIDPRVREALHAIPTTFAFAPGEMEAIERGVANIFGDRQNAAHDCVRRLGELIAAPEQTRPVLEGNTWCGGGTLEEKEERQRIQKR